MCQARSVIFPDYRIFLFPRHHTRQMGKVFPLTPDTSNKVYAATMIRNIELYLGRFGVDRSTLDLLQVFADPQGLYRLLGDDFKTWTIFSVGLGFFVSIGLLHGNRFVKPRIMGRTGTMLTLFIPCHVMRFFPRCVHDRFRDQSSASAVQGGFVGGFIGALFSVFIRFCWSS